MTHALIPYRPAAITVIDTQQESNTLGGIVKRNQTWHLRMRVPVRYSHIEKRAVLLRSLKTGDEREARARAAVVERQILSELDARLLGRETPGSRSHYDAIVTLTTARGFGYKTAEELADGDVMEALRRIESLVAAGDEPGSAAAKALLGAVERPRETLTDVASTMHEKFKIEVRDKNRKQERVWKARWTRPAQKVVKILGFDPIFVDITREQAVQLYQHLEKMVLNGETKGESAQKDLQNLDLMWRKYFKWLKVDASIAPQSPFKGLTEGLARNDEPSRKKEVPLKYIEAMLKPGALASLHPELADIVLILAETGCRQSEVTDVPARSIFLDDDVPHIWVRHETGDGAREVKNKITGRKVPLLGAALEAMKRHPNGFPKYNGMGTFSGEANRNLKDLGLLPEDVTIGGLRHSFETRLKNAGVDTDDRGELMGHSVKRIRGREHYGNEMPLEMRAELMNRIVIKRAVAALPPPTRA